MGSSVAVYSDGGYTIGFDVQMHPRPEQADPAVITINNPVQWSYASSGDMYREGLRVELPAARMDALAIAWLQHRISVGEVSSECMQHQLGKSHEKGAANSGTDCN